MALRTSGAFGRVGGGIVGAALAVLAAFGCATGPRLEYTPTELRDEASRRASDLEASEIEVPFELGPEPVARARSVLRTSARETRMQALVNALSDPAVFGLRYEWATTAPAAATLERGAGNCFSLSSVLVGLARGAGLRAYYVEVDVAEPEWRHDGAVMVQADHIAAVVVQRGQRVYVDFSGKLDRANRVRVIGDLEALAHFYNNRGYELLHLAERAGEPPPWEEAGRAFEVATRLEPGMARAWSNLGVARARLGDSQGAKQAYEQAIEVSANAPSAHLNLALLHLREGALDDAAMHLRAAGRLDPRNPQLEGLRHALRVEGVDPEAPGAD